MMEKGSLGYGWIWTSVLSAVWRDSEVRSPRTLVRYHLCFLKECRLTMFIFPFFVSGVLGAPFSLTPKPSPPPKVQPPPLPMMPTRPRTSSSIFSLLNADPVSPISSSHPRPPAFTPDIVPPSAPASALPVVSEVRPSSAPPASPQLSLRSRPPSPSPPSPKQSPVVESRAGSQRPSLSLWPHEDERSPWPSSGHVKDDPAHNTAVPERRPPSASHSPMSDVQSDEDHRGLRRSRQSPSPPLPPLPSNALQLSTTPVDADAMEVDDGARTPRSPSPAAVSAPAPLSPPSLPPPDELIDAPASDVSRSPSPAAMPSPSTRSPSPSSTSAPVHEEDVVVKAVEESPASPSIRSTDSRELDIEVGEVEDRRDGTVEAAADDKEDARAPPNGVTTAEVIEVMKLESVPPQIEGSPVEERHASASASIEKSVEPVPSEDQHPLLPSSEEPHPEEKPLGPEPQPNTEAPSASEAPKVKLSMADYRKRKKKQREEASAMSVSGTAPTTPSVEASSKLHGGPSTVESERESSAPSAALTVPSEGVAVPTSPATGVVTSIEVEVTNGRDEEKAAESTAEITAETAQPDLGDARSSPVEARKDSAATDELLARFYNNPISSTTTPITPILESPLLLRPTAETSNAVPSEVRNARSPSVSDRRGSVLSVQSHSTTQDHPSSSIEVKQEQMAEADRSHEQDESSTRWRGPRTPEWRFATFPPPLPPSPPPPPQTPRQAQEDGEILSTPSTPAPRSPVTTRPYARKDNPGPFSAPPTQPRSFRHSPPPPSGSSRGSLSPPRSRDYGNERNHTPNTYRPRSPLSKGGSGYISSYRDRDRGDPRAIPANPRSVPSGPRALRDPPSRHIPSNGSAALDRSFSRDRDRDRDRTRPPPAGPSYNASRTSHSDRDRDRGWVDWDRDRARPSGTGPPSSRSRGSGSRF